jgi:hypothetical protein
MAQSEFLKHQDKNGDLLIDKCEVPLPGPEEKVCLDCVKNPQAVLTDWKNLTIDSPRLNEKTCNYEVTVTTRFTSTGGQSATSEEDANASLMEKFNDYKDEAINALLDAYQKDDGIKSFEAMRAAIEMADWDLEARPNSRLKFLYAVPFSVLNNLEDASEDSDDTEEDGPLTASFLASELIQMNIRVRKGLNLYSRYAKVTQIIDKETMIFVESRKPFNVGDYGDAGFSRTSAMSRVVRDLDAFLTKRDLNLPGVGGGFFKDRVIKLKFNFTAERKLKKLTVYTVGCREKPRVFKGKKISALNRKDSFKDKTAMNYLANLREMDTGLTAREPEPFLTFLKKHTYPAIDVINSTVEINTQTQGSRASCVADALASEAKQIGQDILDEALNIADVLAYCFHKNICKRTDEELRKEAVVMGQNYTNVRDDTLDPCAIGVDPTKTMSTNQFFRRIESEDNVFVLLCLKELYGIETGSSGNSPRQLWDSTFNKLKICGLFDFMIEAIQCLFKGLTLEQALSRAILSALKAMSIENFGSLFVGLPPDKQAELNALAQRKLNSGDLFGSQAGAQLASDASSIEPLDPTRTIEDQPLFGDRGKPLFGDESGEGRINFVQPWTDESVIDAERESLKSGPYEGTTPSGRFVQTEQGATIRRSLGRDYDNPNALQGQQTPVANAITSARNEAKQTFSPDQIMEAYVLALIEVYSDNLLDLVEMLNRFPGAEIISKVIALFDCPRPPIFTPSVMSFLKDIELPFCRNSSDITLPQLFNPLSVINLDVLKILAEQAKNAIRNAIINALLSLMIKICEIIGDAICKAIATAGSLAAGLPELLTGRNTVKNILRESICGPNANEQALDDTIVDMFSLLGGVGSEMANRDRVLAFNEAVASSVTRRELIEASLGNPSESFLQLFENVVEFEFPEMAEAFSNRNDITRFYSNFGNLLPADFRDQALDSLDSIPEDDQMPANPSLCATPEQIEEFCSLRSQILDGRASSEQIARLCRPSEAFGDLTDIIQSGIPNMLDNALPPIVSDPGCNNGLFPYETEEQKAVTARSLNAGLEQLKVAFSYDMLGNGPLERNWGLMNMVLSDTLGLPYTAHQRKVFNDPGLQQYVDFYESGSGDNIFQNLTQLNDLETPIYAPLIIQKGAYPVYVAEWMAGIGNAEGNGGTNSNGQLVSFGVNNIVQSDITTVKDFSDLNLGLRVTPLELPDYGYRVEFEVDYESNQVRFVEKQRKANPDLSLSFDNNAQEGEPQRGFTLGLYVADLNNRRNLPADNARIKIIDSFVDKKGEEPIEEVSYEFLAKDNTLDKVSDDTLSQFPEFLESLQSIGSVSPPLVLMSEMLQIPQSSAEIYWNQTTPQLYEQLRSSIMDVGNKSFSFGATPDDLTTEDTEYLHPDGTLYSDKTITDSSGEERKIRNSDAILGISRDQYDNDLAGTPEKTRVFYLDPATYGGTYLNPPVYIKPVPNSGWLGLVDSVFPEISPCKPYKTQVVDFEEIEKEMMKSYNGLSEDKRLQGDPDCVTEVPYNRILSRQGKAGIQSIISAACKIHGTAHFIKSIATFSKFKLDFDNNFSDLYAHFIIEEMEKDFKNAQNIELFNPFKDEEFWYAFLEQSVQTYGRLLDEGEVIDPPEDVIKALIRLNNIQERYNYPDRDTYTKRNRRTGEITTVTGLRDAKKNGEVSIFKTLKNYRNEDALGVVKETEEIAKLVLKEFVKKELKEIGEAFERTLKTNGFIDETYATNKNYYLLDSRNGLTAGSQLNLLGELREKVSDDLLTREVKYTNGDEMSLQDGTPYIGYYHFRDEQPMTGEEHNDESEDLNLFAKNVIVAAGGLGIGKVSELMPSGDFPFGLRAYLKTPSGQRNPYDLGEITNQEGNVSDVYPGTLSKVTNEAGRVVGLEGELGLRYGLEFYAKINGQMVSVTNVEIDVLDLPLAKLPPLQPNSKEMLCLINNLIDDDKFKLFVDYCLPSRKILSTIAIYNDLAFLASIGENYVADARKNGAQDSKPGLREDGETPLSGWFPKEERFNRNRLFVLSWDEWDQQTLRRSNKQLKKMFKEYYNSREFGEFQDDEDDTTTQTALKSLRDKFRLAPGRRILPWWKRRNLRSNPFNSKGELCKNKDE